MHDLLYRTIRHGSTLTAALYQCDVPYFTVVLRKVFGVAGAAFVDNRVPNARIAWPSGDWGSLPLEGNLSLCIYRPFRSTDSALIHHVSSRGNLCKFDK